MTPQDRPPDTALSVLYLPLLAQIETQLASCEEKVRDLEEAVREAEAWQRRRAARQDRDKACYRIGAALEPQGGLALDDVFLTGLDKLGAHGLALLVAQALVTPGGASLSELMMSVSRTPAGRIVREWGVWARFIWNKALYQEEVTDFENSPAGRGKRRSWRREAITVRQAYLVGELARFLQVDAPEFTRRGEAHDWLLTRGGNPRFLIPVEKPALPSLADLFSS